MGPKADKVILVAEVDKQSVALEKDMKLWVPEVVSKLLLSLESYSKLLSTESDKQLVAPQADRELMVAASRKSDLNKHSLIRKHLNFSRTGLESGENGPKRSQTDFRRESYGVTNT